MLMQSEQQHNGGDLYLCAQYTDLTPVDHWLKRVETARRFCALPFHLSRPLPGPALDGLRVGWRTQSLRLLSVSTA